MSLQMKPRRTSQDRTSVLTIMSQKTIRLRGRGTDGRYKLMSIKEISTDELRRMKDREGIVFQGCGGSLDEWVDGVNEMLTESGILQNGTKFTDVYSFENDNLTNLLFPFDEKVNLDIGKLAMWRIASYQQFYGSWLSDYVDNYLDGFIDESVTAESQKPDCELIGQDGNIFSLMGIASRTLRNNGMAEQATEMCNRIQNGAESYYQALGIIGEYVNITGPNEDMCESNDFTQSM